ncbi:hypothetical protein [Vibrio phage pTD1]|uniref:Uncharacterized protein n=1 Tax=Vibrio phage pTD1 TaxID=1938577 RepID=A0A1Q2U2P5_9CAUD|nr:hypothetical protein FDH33_gp021 [Vibrio phage pTD1]BAW98230.1 hypothetical protein [Vibrio phage pTD1]
MKDPRQMLITRMSEVRILNAKNSGDPAKLEEAERLFKDLKLEEVTISNIQETAPGSARYSADIDLSQRGGGVIKQFWSPATPTDGLRILADELEMFSSQYNFMSNKPVYHPILLEYYGLNEVAMFSGVIPFNDFVVKKLVNIDSELVKTYCFDEYVVFAGPFINGIMPVRDLTDLFPTECDHPDIKITLWHEDANGVKQYPLGPRKPLKVGPHVTSKIIIDLESVPGMEDGDIITVYSTEGGAYYKVDTPTGYTYAAGSPLEIIVDDPAAIGKCVWMTLSKGSEWRASIQAIPITNHSYQFMLDGTINASVTYPTPVTGSFKFKPVGNAVWEIPEDDERPGLYLFDREELLYFVEFNDQTMTDFEFPVLNPGIYELAIRTPGAYSFQRGGMLEIAAPE